MLISKVEADEKLIQQVNELKLDLQSQKHLSKNGCFLSAVTVETGVQTEDMMLLQTSVTDTQEGAAPNHHNVNCSNNSELKPVVYNSSGTNNLGGGGGEVHTKAALSNGQSSMTGGTDGGLGDSQLN